MSTTTIEESKRIDTAIIDASAISPTLAEAGSIDLVAYELNDHTVSTARTLELGGFNGRLGVRLSRITDSPGWAVLSFDPTTSDDAIVRAATVSLCLVGHPFRVIDTARGLWNDLGVDASKKPGEFSGLGLNSLHIDVPNVEFVPDFTALLCLRPDPAGGGESLISDLHKALHTLSKEDQEELTAKVFYEGRVFGLSGVGKEKLPFSVLEEIESTAWVRFGGKMVTDERNAGHRNVLERLDEAVDRQRIEVRLGRGQMLVLDQSKCAHGRLPLGNQLSVLSGTTRYFKQAKARYDRNSSMELAFLPNSKA